VLTSLSEYVRDSLTKGSITKDQARQLLEMEITTMKQAEAMKAKIRQAEEAEEKYKKHLTNQSDNFANILTAFTAQNTQMKNNPQERASFQQQLGAELREKGSISMANPGFSRLIEAASTSMQAERKAPVADPLDLEIEKRMKWIQEQQQQKAQMDRQYLASREPWMQQNSYSYQPKPIEASGFSQLAQRHGDRNVADLLRQTESILEGDGTDVGTTFKLPSNSEGHLPGGSLKRARTAY